jgi:phenol 2-monooxygenase
MQLGHVAEADGRWRVYVFSDAGGLTRGSRAAGALDKMAGKEHVGRFTPPGADVDSVVDVRVVIAADHRDVRLDELPELARPRKGALGLVDYEKAFCVDPDPARDIYALRGIDRAAGCLVVVRPDQYVAGVLPLDALDDLGAFLAGFLRPGCRAALTGER